MSLNIFTEIVKVGVVTGFNWVLIQVPIVWILSVEGLTMMISIKNDSHV